MTPIKFTLIAVVLIFSSCFVFSPTHEFPEKILFNPPPGDAQSDLAAVNAIIRLNNLPADTVHTIAEFSNSNRIVRLNLSFLGIDTLPDEIGNLGALEGLNLSHNKLTTLPDSIVKLHVFIFRAGNISNTADGCYCNDSLNGLTISWNRLCRLPVAQSAWIDRQYGISNYLVSDNTQQCNGEQNAQ